MLKAFGLFVGLSITAGLALYALLMTAFGAAGVFSSTGEPLLSVIMGAAAAYFVLSLLSSYFCFAFAAKYYHNRQLR